MPTYLPARLGVQYSEAIAEAMASAKVGEPILLTLELYREGWLDEDGNPAVARVVNDFRPFYATLEDDAPNNPGELVTFQGVPFRYVKPEQTDSGAPAAVNIEIDNVSQQLTALLLQEKTSREPLYLIEREYLPSDITAPHVLPPTRLVLSNVEATVTGITAQATFGDLTNRRFPTMTYTRERFPGLTAR